MYATRCHRKTQATLHLWRASICCLSHSVILGSHSCICSFQFVMDPLCFCKGRFVSHFSREKVVVRWLGFALEFCCSQQVSIEHIKAETTAVDGSGLHRATSPPKNSVDMWMCTCLASAFWMASEDSNAQSHEVSARGNKTIPTSTNAGPVVRPRIICGGRRVRSSKTSSYHTARVRQTSIPFSCVVFEQMQDGLFVTHAFPLDSDVQLLARRRVALATSARSRRKRPKPSVTSRPRDGRG